MSCCLLTTVHTDRIFDFWLVYICYKMFLMFIYFQRIMRSFKKNNNKIQ